MRTGYDEVMEILNPKEEQALDSMEEDAVQYQQRKRDDEKPKKRKKATYSEVETLFMIWSNGPAPVGEVKYFARFGKIHYYEKTENGCVEISNAQYNERAGRDAEKAYRRVQRQINGAADSNGDAQRNLSGSMDSNRNSGSASAVSGQAFGEELRNDARRIVSGGGGYGYGTAVTDSDDFQHQQRTGTLSNREILELAASELQSVDLAQAE